MSPDKFGDVEGFVCIIAQHPSFICNCNSRFIHLKNTSHFLRAESQNLQHQFLSESNILSLEITTHLH